MGSNKLLLPLGKSTVIGSFLESFPYELFQEVILVYSDDRVKAAVSHLPVTVSIDGLIRGMIRDQFRVEKGLKIIDIDPRANQPDNCFTISDKARCISGSVLEVLVQFMKR